MRLTFGLWLVPVSVFESIKRLYQSNSSFSNFCNLAQALSLPLWSNMPRSTIYISRTNDARSEGPCKARWALLRSRLCKMIRSLKWWWVAIEHFRNHFQLTSTLFNCLKWNAEQMRIGRQRSISFQGKPLEHPETVLLDATTESATTKAVLFVDRHQLGQSVAIRLDSDRWWLSTHSLHFADQYSRFGQFHRSQVSRHLSVSVFRLQPDLLVGHLLHRLDFNYSHLKALPSPSPLTLSLFICISSFFYTF